jgi:hypothetical protein
MIRNNDEMTDHIIFYHIVKTNDYIDFSHWFNTDIQLKIVVEIPPEETVYKQCPNIHWIKTNEFQEFKKINKDDKIFVELPSLFHVPHFGKQFDRDMKFLAGHGIIIPVFDFEWVYYTKSDDIQQNILRFSQDQVCIENKMTNREEWIDIHIRPSWEVFYQHQLELDIYQRRVFLGLSKILGEWKIVEELSPLCDWGEPIVEYDKAEAFFHTNIRTPIHERQQQFFKKLNQSPQYWFETWWKLLEFTDTIPTIVDVSTICSRLVKKAVSRTKLNDETDFPEWCHEMPICRWVHKNITDEDILYKRETSLLQKSPEYTEYWRKYLFAKTLRLKNHVSHQLFTQECTNFLNKLSKMDGCENGDLIASTQDTDYVPSSSGLIVYPENPRWYLVNVRKVNYRILPNGSYVTLIDGKINNTYNGISKNEFYFMDRETLKPVSPIRQMNEDIPGKREEELAIVGLEDVRLVPGTEQDILFYGVTKSYSYSDAIRIITGKYNVERTLFHSTRVIHPPYEENACEKNWTWCGNNRFIYQWHPVEIGSVDTNDRLVVDERIPSPAYFKEFRGSSPAVVWKGFHFFSVHSVAHGENGRKYIHYIVILDLQSKQHKVVGVSLPFCFENAQIEYNIGMDIYKGKILFLYSTRDSTSRYMRIPLFHILENMIFINEETGFKTKIFQDIF